jgi:proline iminopeptidase
MPPAEFGRIEASIAGMDEIRQPDALFPPPEPYDTGWLDVGAGHRIYFEQCGLPEGLPVLFLHGGPGSGCSPRHRQLCDPAHCRVVLFDQRGCGRSQPRGALQANTSEHLVADIEVLRRRLGIERWLVVGGSWGAGLALAYAAAHPAACLGLVLRGVFLGRASDLDWFFQQARQLLPDAWATLVQEAPMSDRADVLRWLGTGLLGDQPQVALTRAQAWQAWENAMSERRTVAPPSGNLPDEAAAALVDKYRVQSHYLVHGCFWGEEGLLARAKALAAVPTAILHGRLDWVCRPQAAWELHRGMPGSRLQWVEACGHSLFEPAMTLAWVQTIGHFLTHASFAGWGADYSGTGTS